MKVLVDVNDNKADFILELLNNFPFAKAKPISQAKAQPPLAWPCARMGAARR
jgi:hypothetical protein